MPGAPNRPPEPTQSGPIAPPATPEEGPLVLRRLAPSRIALSLELWKGAPHRDLLDPLARAEGLYRAGDHRGALSALDQLSVRFAEPRWPTLPEPFRQLRVSIPAPMPPHYDPEHALPPAEKEARRLRRTADGQLALATASVAWARARGLPTEGLSEPLSEARAALEGTGPTEAFWRPIDRLWSSIAALVPEPTGPAARPASPAPNGPRPPGPSAPPS